MLVTPAVGTWLLTAPLDRTALVRGRLLGTSVVAALVGAALAATGAALSAYPVDVIGWLTLLAGTVCVLLVAVATVDQARGGQVVRLLAWSLGVVLWVGLVLVARDSVPALLRVPAVAPLRVAVVVTAVAGRRAARPGLPQPAPHPPRAAGVGRQPPARDLGRAGQPRPHALLRHPRRAALARAELGASRPRPGQRRGRAGLARGGAPAAYAPGAGRAGRRTGPALPRHGARPGSRHGRRRDVDRASARAWGSSRRSAC